MAGRHLLDTNIIIASFKNEQTVLDQMATSEEIFIPAIVVGELFYGAMHSTNIEKHITQVREFVKESSVLSCDEFTAEHYGQIKNELKKKGRPLPENDIWIAAIALQHNLTIATRDQHFKEIDGVAIEEW